jgi:hypothetical protein
MARERASLAAGTFVVLYLDHKTWHGGAQS